MKIPETINIQIKQSTYWCQKLVRLEERRRILDPFLTNASGLCPKCLKIITWDKILSFLENNTEQSKSLKTLFGINENNKKNAVQIVKDYYKDLAEGLISRSLNDLKEKNKQNVETIKNSTVIINGYKNLNWLQKLFAKGLKKNAEKSKNKAEEDIKKNNENIKILENTKIKID